MNKVGDWVIIYSHALAKTEEVGEAELIEKLNEKARTERWLVRFKGEHKLEARTIERIFEEEERPEPKMRKRLVNGKIKYYDPEKEEEKRQKKAQGKKYLDKDGVLKYRYKKQRDDQERRYSDSFKEFMKQIRRENEDF